MAQSPRFTAYDLAAAQSILPFVIGDFVVPNQTVPLGDPKFSMSLTQINTSDPLPSGCVFVVFDTDNSIPMTVRGNDLGVRIQVEL